MRLLAEGKDLKEIRTYIDAEYSRYGPSTNTEPIGDAQRPCNEPAETCDEPGRGEQVLDYDALAPVTTPEKQTN